MTKSTICNNASLISSFMGNVSHKYINTRCIIKLTTPVIIRRTWHTYLVPSFSTLHTLGQQLQYSILSHYLVCDLRAHQYVSLMLTDWSQITRPKLQVVFWHNNLQESMTSSKTMKLEQITTVWQSLSLFVSILKTFHIYSDTFLLKFGCVTLANFWNLLSLIIWSIF